jgi:arsenate reductase (thioredoxin)
MTQERTYDPTRPSWANLPLEQSVALRAAAARLAVDFEGIFGTETIERFLHSSFDQFADHSTIPTFLPLMAMGFFTHLAGEAAVAWSGGSEPGTTVNPAAVAAMRERGIDISGEFPKPWTDETVRAADVVITMGCGDSCPLFPGKRYEEWVLDDPAGQGVEAVRPIRDDIERRVRTLLAELAVPVSG